MDKINNISIIDFYYFLKLCFISGFSLGFIAMPFYVWTYLAKSDWISVIIGVFSIPIANGIFISIYGMFGYPLYKYLAKHRKFGLDKLNMSINNSGQP